jgi:Tol biopolymer transport system component
MTHMTTHRAVIGLIGTATLGLATVVTPPAGAAPESHRGLPGIIAFQRADQDDQWQLWVANADLTNQRQISFGPYTSGFGSWKPDGTRLAFDSNRSDPDLGDDAAPNDVFTMNPDGTDVVQVTDFPPVGFSGDPDWSPNGRWLTYESDLGDYPAKQGIYVSRPDGSHLHRVTTLPRGYEFDIAPQFSPDGKRIVFTRFRLDDQGNETSELHVVNVDGTHETPLAATADLYPGDANWSPDGKTLVFEAYLPIFSIRPDGTHLRQLTEGQRPDGFTASSDPVYSPDGHQIMLLRSERTPQFDIITIGLSVMLKNGQQLHYVTDNPSEATQEHQPDWIIAPRLTADASQAQMPAQGAALPSTLRGRHDVYAHRR